MQQYMVVLNEDNKFKDVINYLVSRLKGAGFVVQVIDQPRSVGPRFGGLINSFRLVGC